MNAHTALPVQGNTTSPSDTPVTVLVRLYQQVNAIQQQLDAATSDVADAARNSYLCAADLAASVMREPPSNLGDVALQLGFMASWLGVVVDAVGRSDSAISIARAAERACSNALYFISNTEEELPIDGDVLDLHNHLYAEAVCHGAKMSADAHQRVFGSARQ